MMALYSCKGGKLREWGCLSPLKVCKTRDIHNVDILDGTLGTDGVHVTIQN